MSNKFEPRIARTVLALSIAAIGATAQPFAWAADADDEVARLIRPDSVVEVGVGYVSEGSYKFGDYTGLQHEGVHLIGNVSVVRRGLDDPGYVEIEGRNLGLDSRSLGIKTGQQGNYGVRIEYDEIPKLWSDSYQTPYLGAGSTNLTLPAGWVSNCATTAAPGTAVPCTTNTATATTALMPLLNASMRPFNVDTKRKSVGVGVSKQLPTGWDADVSVKHETKEGTRFIGATFGTGGGNPRAAILPEPVDYTTNSLEALLRYTDDKLQMQFGYYVSLFNNENPALKWQNAFSNGTNAGSTVWGPTFGGILGYPNGFGQISLPPDNQMHQIGASAGYSVTKDTRVSGSLSFGRMTQNDAFLPYSVNTRLTVTTPMPRSSLDGRVDTTHADLKLSSKLMPKLHLTAGYRYDERDNKTPQAQYQYIGGDSMNQAALATGNTRTNLPGSSTKQQVDAELDYHWTTSTKLRFGYDYEWAKKTFEAIKDEREHTVKAEVHQHFNEMLSGGLEYAYSDRKTSPYDASAPFLATFPAAYTATQAATGLWDNVPTQKKFFMAPRIRDKVRAFVNASPNENIDLTLGLDYKNDDYHESQYGLQRAKGWAVNFDVNVVASETLSGHVFTSVDSYGTTQRSIALGGAKTNITNTGLDWGADISDRTLTAGAGVRYTPRRNYQFGADLTHATSTGRIGVFTGPAIAATAQATPLPDLKTRLGRLDLFGQYQLQKDVTLRMKYIYERYSSADWSVDQVLPATLAAVIGTNQVAPKYNVHVIGVSVAYQF
jgi:MtrB/PioB family decaheme-associated outer membrane protein